MIPDSVINCAVLAMMLTVVVFKFLLWRLTRFWPFLVFVVAFVYVSATRIALIFDPHVKTADWVFFFWPLFTVGTVGLYLSLHRNMRPAGRRLYGRRIGDLKGQVDGRRKGDLKPPVTK